jgi:hypothetical protein
MGRRTSARRLVEAGLAVRGAKNAVADERLRRQLQRAELQLRAELGGSVPKSVAARVLGISTTALERWVDAGKLPTVRRPGGREEVAAEALLDVAEEVVRLREEGVARGLVAEALRRLEPRGLPRRRLRPNEPASELRGAFSWTTPAERLRETAELSLAATTLAGYGARRRAGAADGG